jgi:microcystin-dependent protein
MADQFLGEIRAVGFNFAPQGWALCNGQLLPISQNTALFSLLGVNFGGDGRSTFGLPNLQGNAPMDQGNGAGLSPRAMGEAAGSTAVTLLTSEMPSHNHIAANAAASTSEAPATNVVFGGGGRGKAEAFGTPSASVAQMSAQALAVTGGSQPHNNMPPYVTLNFIIALQGIFPARS